jgi:hypothetical protein
MGQRVNPDLASPAGGHLGDARHELEKVDCDSDHHHLLVLGHAQLVEALRIASNLSSGMRMAVD